MGIFDRWRKKKGKTVVAEDAKYVLTRKGKTGGFEKVMDLAKNMEPEDLYQSLSAGIYAVHIYKKGQSGFESGPVFEVLGDDEKKTATGAASGSPFAGLKEFAQGWKTMRDDAKETFAIMGELFSEKKVTMDDAMGYLEQLKTHKKTLDDLFPGATTKSQDIPLSGSIPAWMAFVPQVIDQSADALERRLQRWGLIEEGAGAGEKPPEDFIKLPERPKAVERVEKRETGEKKGAEFTIELPEKPSIEKKEEVVVREAEITEEKKEDEEGGGEPEGESGT